MNTPTPSPIAVGLPKRPPVGGRGRHGRSQEPSPLYNAGARTACGDRIPLAAEAWRPAPRVGRALAAAIMTWLLSMLGLFAAAALPSAHAGTVYAIPDLPGPDRV